MKKNSLVKSVFYVVGCLVMAVTLVSYFNTSSSSAQQQGQSDAMTVSRLQEGLGREVEFGKACINPTGAEMNVEALTGFIEKRSDLKTSLEVKKRLAKLESECQNGRLGKVSIDELTDKAVKVLFERLSTLNDSEINQTIESLRGFNSPTLPESFVKGRETLKLRPNYVSNLRPEEGRAQLKSALP